METDPQLHHCAQNITTGSLENVLELYSLFNCRVIYKPDNGYQWAMVGQEQLNFLIQIVEIEGEPIKNLDQKRQTHVAFLSENPQDLVNKVEQWAKDKDIQFVRGQWNERELYFDLPNLFLNFVIEVMHTSVTEE